MNQFARILRTTCTWYWACDVDADYFGAFLWLNEDFKEYYHATGVVCDSNPLATENLCKAYLYNKTTQSPYTS